MKLIESSAQFIPQESGLEGIYKQIELAGRTCYKSEDKITEDSAKGFVDRMIASHHTAMLEHGTVYLCLPMEYSDIIYKYERNQYSKVGDAYNGQAGDWQSYPIVSNLRVLVENNWLDDLQYLCSPTEFHEKRYTFRFTTSIGITRELIRHRKFSFANESTRYCNYNKQRFGGELTFIKPYWLQDSDAPKTRNFITAFETAELVYNGLTSANIPAQAAREILPLATKSDIIMTGFASDWRHFFDLRMWGKTGAPHPDMKELATKAMLAAQDAGIWMSIEKQPSKFK